jgi:hypothetical protein
VLLEDLKPKGMHKKSNKPASQTKAVSHLDSSLIGNCQYPLFASKQLMNFALPIFCNKSSIFGVRNQYAAE